MPRWLKHPGDFHELAVTPRDRVVDVGCGLGSATLALAQAGAEVLALDVDPYAINQTKARIRDANAGARCRVEWTDCDPIPVTDAWATVVICTEVLEHVDDPVRFLDELSRIGAPGARFLISVPDPFAERLMKVVAPASYFERPGHQRIYQHSTLDRLVREAGLTVHSRPVYPHGFFWSIYWTFGWASGSREFGPGCAIPPPPLVTEWSELYHRIQSDPRTEPLIEVLDRTGPKTQAIFAVKGTTGPENRSARRRLDKPAGELVALPFRDAIESELRRILTGSQGAEISDAWRGVWSRFEELPDAARVIEILDKVPLFRPERAGPGGIALAHLSLLSRRMRDGRVRLGGYDLKWTIRRVGSS
jgi:SAM-dependent methyltransferase